LRGGSNDKNGAYPNTKLLKGVARVSIKNEGNGEINYRKCIAASRPDSIIPGTLWIGGSNDKNEVCPTTKLLNGVARVSIKNEGTREINYGNCTAASRPDPITPRTRWIGDSNDKDGVYPTIHLLTGVAGVSMKIDRTLEINYGNSISTSRPDRITPGTLWIGGSNVKIGVYPTTQLLTGVARVSIKNERTPEINYENCNAASRPDRTTPGAHWIGRSNDKNGVYPAKQLLKGVVRFPKKMKEI
jgi:hypothetical protein